MLNYLSPLRLIPFLKESQILAPLRLIPFLKESQILAPLRLIPFLKESQILAPPFLKVDLNVDLKVDGGLKVL
jgi:hypothetical protein